MTRIATLTLTLAIAFLAGAAPVLTWLGSIRIGRVWLLGLAAGAGLVLSALGVWAGREDIAGERRRWWEYAAAGISSAAQPAVFGAFAALVYLAVHWAVRGLNTWFGWTLSRETAPFWAALVVFGLTATVVWVAIPRSVVRRMYPGSGAAASAYAGVLRAVDKDFWYGLFGSAVLAAIGFVDSIEAAGYVGATLLLIVGGNALTPRQPTETAPSMDTVAQEVAIVQAGFEAAGFECVAYPRTGKPGVDAALESLHLVASTGACTVAVEVLIGEHASRFELISGGEATAFGASQVSAVVVAAWALSEHLDGVDRVWPVVVSRGPRPDRDATAYANRRQVTMLGPHSIRTIYAPCTTGMAAVAKALGYANALEPPLRAREPS